MAQHMLQKISLPRGKDHLDLTKIERMAHGIFSTRPDEIACDECFEQIDLFVEMTLAGKDPAQAMPLVQDHLDRCHDCREEFEALLKVLVADDV